MDRQDWRGAARLGRARLGQARQAWRVRTRIGLAGTERLGWDRQGKEPQDMNALTTTEKTDLARCERVIERGQKTFLEVGKALAEIRDRKLYRERCETFADYCTQTWGFSRQHAYRLIDAAHIEDQLQSVSPTGDNSPVLASERHARELRRLPEEDRAEALDEARQRFGGNPSVAEVAEVVAEFRGERHPGYTMTAADPDDVGSFDEIREAVRNAKGKKPCPNCGCSEEDEEGNCLQCLDPKTPEEPEPFGTTEQFAEPSGNSGQFDEPEPSRSPNLVATLNQAAGVLKLLAADWNAVADAHGCQWTVDMMDHVLTALKQFGPDTFASWHESQAAVILPNG